MRMERRKRLFDCAVTNLAAPLWVPLLLVCALVILIADGRPIFYISLRQTARAHTRRVFKFRTMRRDADKIANRDTVPISGRRFLNISSNSPLYTSVGRLIERLGLTELPQLLHVLSGHMSLVGNRPLPDRVMEVLRQAHPNVDERFLTKAGLVGPVQLVGRDNLTDAERLWLEAQYCRLAASEDYTLKLDFWLLCYTLFVLLSRGRTFSPETVSAMMDAWCGVSRTSRRAVASGN
ncbi:MAG TPA: sugar transferase [Stellaceae bacterium]|jgi:lipopolysaccharide/colanic/teichoic acid biosynthesis glycosyltransferase